MLNRYAGTPRYEKLMAASAHRLARRFLRSHPNSIGQTIWISTSNEDFDVLAVPLKDTLDAAGAVTSISCLWTIFNPGTDLIPDTSCLVAQAHRHDEKRPTETDILLHVSSSLAECAIAVDTISRVSQMISAKNVVVLTLSATDAEIATLVERANWFGLTGPTVIRLSDARDSRVLLSNLREHLTRAYGRSRIAYLPVTFGGTGRI